MKKHKEKIASRILLFIFTLTGLVFSIYLVVSEVYNPGFCPLLFNMPACYLVLASFMLVLISLFINTTAVRFLVFYIGAFSGIGIATWFLVGQITGTKECPDLFNIPLCFGSGILFILIVIFGSMKTRE